jgi:hypothetical protein
VIKQLSQMLIETRKRDDMRTAENSAPLSIAATFAFAEAELASFGSKSSLSTIQI